MEKTRLVILVIIIIIVSILVGIFIRKISLHAPSLVIKGKVNQYNYKPSTILKSSSFFAYKQNLATITLPTYFKYKEHFLLPTRNQGQCGSCWAFAVTKCISDRIAVFTGVKIPLSVQELVSCDKNDFGCDGGDPEMALNYIAQNGIYIETKYPYDQTNDTNVASCRTIKTDYDVHVDPSSISNLCVNTSNLRDGEKDKILKTNIQNMKNEIFTNGPIIGAIEVYDDFYNYTGLDVYEPKPGSTKVGGHAIEIYGWSNPGANTNEKAFKNGYWLCKNSWGKDWPSKSPEKFGWFAIQIGKNTCGIEDRAWKVNPILPKKVNNFEKRNAEYHSYQEYISDNKDRVNYLGE